MDETVTEIEKSDETYIDHKKDEGKNVVCFHPVSIAVSGSSFIPLVLH